MRFKNSAEAGKYGELKIQKLLKKAKFVFEYVAKTPKKGDFIVKLQNFEILIDVKNPYKTKKIPMKEVLKTSSDVLYNNCLMGIIVNIQKEKTNIEYLASHNVYIINYKKLSKKLNLLNNYLSIKK